MSKRKWHHPEVPAEENTTKVWRSVGELEDTPQFREQLDREFPQAAAMMRDEDDRETSRRDFMKLMGATAALAGVGLAACRRPESLIVPFANAPEWIIPGKPLYYASSMPTAQGAVPMMVTTFEGRPTKLAPNSLLANDGTNAVAQASVLNLYDPQRSRYFLKKGTNVKRGEAEQFLANSVKSGKVAFVFGEDDSPTRNRLARELAIKHAGAKFYTYEALAGEGRKASNAAIFGKGASLVANFSKADRVLSIDSDFLETDKQGPVKGFYDRRHVNGRDYSKKADKNALNRLYVAETSYTVTGGLADHRAPIAPSEVGRFLATLAKAVGVEGVTVPGEAYAGNKAKWIKECAKDLKDNRGKSVVLLGSRYGKELHDLAALINKQLGAYGRTLEVFQTGKAAYGSIADLAQDIESKAVETVIFATPANPIFENPVLEVAGKQVAFADLAKKVTTIHLGERTDATARAADLHIPAAHYLESWSDSRTIDGVYTAVQPMILPLYGGISEVELLVALLGDKVELFNSLTDDAQSPAYAEVRKTFAQVSGDSSVAALKKLLREGFWAGTKYDAVRSVNPPAVPSLKAAKALSKDNLDIVFLTDNSIVDGRYINNAWLQEAPDPVSKLTWDNALYISPKTAHDLGLYDEIVELEKEEKVWWTKLGIDSKPLKTSKVSEDGEGPHLHGPMVKVTVNGQELELPVIVAFGQADNVLAVSLGYGQGYDEHWGDDFKKGLPSFYSNQAITAENVSPVGVNRGFNAYPLRQGADLFSTGATVSSTGARYKLARTQEHHSMYGRAIAREISTMDKKGSHGDEDFQAQLKKVKKHGMDSHIPPNLTLYKQEDRKGEKHLSDKMHQWAMSIDLNVCNGCNACLVACQSENNIPVVGKTQVAMGREMHWIRMDRYFAAPDESKLANDASDWEKAPEMIPQPVACVQCESAPCETVCPVNATVHTEDGLNAMAYNRCIGTRYCANNCPYKARRFNFFDYNKRNPVLHKNLYKGPLGEKQVGEAPHLQRNPNVTVRMRGVMEKCTYCVQRLKQGKITAKQNQKEKVNAAGVASTQVAIGETELRMKTGSVKVACQEACPSGAIVFGNLLDEKDTIRKIKSADNKPTLDRAYDLLNYIGTLPRTSYLARVKNPNKLMPGADTVGRATINMH